jgi:superfamily II DNA or RNA helicase
MAANFFIRTAGQVNLLGDPHAGWRRPQLGAVGATMAHWSLDDPEPALVSIPTGTGKTAVAMVAPYLGSSLTKRMLVLAPARQIRGQLAEHFRSYDLVHRIGVLPEATGTPSVFEMSGRAANWSALEDYDVVVALPNSISPVHYDLEALPPRDLFDLVVVDEAHHTPADTWTAVLQHFTVARTLLLTATPRRRDGRRVPGKRVYHYPLRRALDEELYQPITPELLARATPPSREAHDRAIVVKAAELLASPDHASSVLMVRGASVRRLHELQEVYRAHGIDLVLLHNRLSPAHQARIISQLLNGSLRTVGVVGMLGEGFDLPSLRLVAYHDKHRSLPATIQLIGRLARVDPRFPQRSVLVTVTDVDVFPELQGVVRELYAEDADWAQILPGVIDDEIEQERRDREFAERLPSSLTEVDPIHLQPLKRAIVYEVPPDWDPTFLDGTIPAELAIGSDFLGGTVVYSGVDTDDRLLVVVVRYVERLRWSSDPALADVRYELHVVAHRRPTLTTRPGFVFLNLARDGVKKDFIELLGLATLGEMAGPERIGGYLDGLNRISVSSVGVRSTNAATRGRASYRNYMGSSVDRGLRNVDMARSALGHVMFQLTTSRGSSNAGAAIEKAKLWLTRYGQLRELSAWFDEAANLLWFPQTAASGPLLPGVDRGHTLDEWPNARPLAAEMHPALLGRGLELWQSASLVGAIEDLDLHVNDDPTGTIQDVDTARGGPLRIVGVLNDRDRDMHKCVWDGLIDTSGAVAAELDLEVRHGYGNPSPLSALLEEYPPTIYFLDGTTTVGAVRYDSRAYQTTVDERLLTSVDWAGFDITAETPRTARGRGAGVRSVHDRLREFLTAQPRRGRFRWILYNDGSGEIADFLVIEQIVTGEVVLGLWHAKASHEATHGVRIKDFQEVVSQALRSRRWFTSATLWDELGSRLAGAKSPHASLVDGSDPRDVLERRVGLADAEDGEPQWSRQFPVVRGRLGIVQPGLSAGAFFDQLRSTPVAPTAQSLRELFGVLSDTAVSDGTELEFVVSP